MSYRKFLKEIRLPTTWCPGCGIGIVSKAAMEIFEELNFSEKDTTVISGIGCSGRIAGYFNIDTVHGCHGRALPVAEGIKTVNPNLNVVVMSGDGDILGIGGNHLIHAARRNADITVICNNNTIYGMTGGQKSPTTALGTKTITSPFGNEDMPVNVQAWIKAHNNFYARTTSFHYVHLKKCIKKALQHKGFSFIEVLSQCPINDGRRRGFKDAYEMMIHYKENFKINNNVEYLKTNEIGITKMLG